MQLEEQGGVGGESGRGEPRSQYPYNKRWRQKNRERYEATKKKYYRQFVAGASNRFRRWLPEEDAAVVAHRECDRVLAERLGRTVQAIQVRRSKKKGGSV